MSDSIREQLMAAITTAVGGLYNTPLPEDERDLPMTVVVEDTEVASDNLYGQTEIDLPVSIARIAEAASNDRVLLRKQANALLAGVHQEMFADETFGDLAIRVTYTGGAIATEINRFAFAQADFTVHYQHVRGDPFTQE